MGILAYRSFLLQQFCNKKHNKQVHFRDQYLLKIGERSLGAWRASIYNISEVSRIKNYNFWKNSDSGAQKPDLD